VERRPTVADRHTAASQYPLGAVQYIAPHATNEPPPVDSAAGEVAVVPGTSAVGSQLRPEATRDLIFRSKRRDRYRGSLSRSKGEGSQAPASLRSDSRLVAPVLVLCDRGTRARGRPPASLRAPRRANSTAAGPPEEQQCSEPVLLRKHPFSTASDLNGCCL
jgi:hypothetical protein